MERLEVPKEGYYSPQQLSSRLLQLDLQVMNLATMVKNLYVEVKGDHTHIGQLDAMVADMQAQIHACAAKHENK
jgi:hypothetical protein